MYRGNGLYTRFTTTGRLRKSLFLPPRGPVLPDSSQTFWLLLLALVVVTVTVTAYRGCMADPWFAGRTGWLRLLIDNIIN